MTLLWLYLNFFKIGLLTIGGGLVALPLLQQEFVGNNLISENLFIDMFAISQSTPGPIGINMATYIGYTNNSILGGIVATLGMVSPSLIIIVFIAHHLKAFKQNIFAKNLLTFLRPTAVGLIASAVIYIFYHAIIETSINWYSESIIFALIIALILLKWKPNPILIILASGLVGMLIF